MDEKMSLRLISDGTSGSEEEDIDNVLAVHGRVNGHLIQNRRHAKRRRVSRVSVLTAVFTLSLLANIVLFILLVMPRSNTKIWGGYPCSTPDTGSEIPFHLPGPMAASQGKLAVSLSKEVQLNKTESPRDIGDTASSGQSDQAAQKPATSTPTSCPPSSVTICQIDHPNQKIYHASASGYDNIFEDLTPTEIQAVYNFLATRSDLRIATHNVTLASHIYAIELHMPNKTDALMYLDGKGSKPVREARAVVERPDLPEPVVEEYVVGPLPAPTYYLRNPRREKGSVPLRFHPMYGLREAFTSLSRTMTRTMHQIIYESYGATFTDCGNRCLMLLPQRTSSAYSDNTLIVLTAYYATDFVTIHPVDLIFVMKETRHYSRTFEVDSVFYAGRSYPSIEHLTSAYRLNSTPRARMAFPRPAAHETTNPGTMNLRGDKFPKGVQAGPKEYEPDGKRYSVTGQHVQYLEWSFNLRMSTASGPQVWDVQWAGERIAYEISLQDIGVIYAGANPTTFYAHLSDSAFGLGDQAYGLVPGADCPEHATFLPQTVYKKEMDGPQILPNAFCLFEHNTGVPLRRHRSDDPRNGNNYGGLPDRVLILRTIIVEYNYDYIFDVVFHQNGAMELKTYATGYIMSQHYYGGEAPFGFRVHEEVVGSIHHHVMNFKIDLDIQGPSNRYETLDFVVDERTWPWHRNGAEKFQQIAFKHNLKHTEQEAVLHYNFSAPKYHIVYNVNEKNKFGNPRAYRIAARGFSKQILPDDSPALRSRAWSKYQMLTTRRKDEEESSSSVFSMFDGASPHVDIERYLHDNESIIDQDLVFWVTVGFHHIPHTEDIPNTPTVGAEASISLLPYNYFPECPSVGSRDAFRADVRGPRLVIQNYGTTRKPNCLPNSFDYTHLMSNVSSLFP